MTDRMHDDQLDRDLRRFLTWQAEDLAGAPAATEAAMRISSRARTRTAGLRLAPQLVWVLLAGLLIAALLGALAIGAMQQPNVPPAPLAYEAVFLRLEVVGDSPEVIVVGVNPEGVERQIARLPGAWIAYDIKSGEGFLSPQGAAVSLGGRLAIASNRGEADLMMHWEVIDLHQPQAEPIIVPGTRQFFEEIRATPYFRVDPRGGAFWGPHEQLAILWYFCSGSCRPDLHLAFVDGPTGATTDVENPNSVLPYWASDGSGVYVGRDPSDIDDRLVLHRDGRVTEETETLPVPSCRTRYGSGAEISIDVDGRLVRRTADGVEDMLWPAAAGIACLAPDDSAILTGGVLGSSAVHPVDRLISTRSGASFEVEGNFAGWMGVDP